MNYNKLTTKKLQALMATASDEDKKTIEAILAQRKQTAAAKTQVQAPVTDAYEDPEMTDEERVAIEAAEKNGGINPLYNGSRTTKAKAKMTDEEREAIIAECQKNVGHKCEAVPFNSAEWCAGYIAGVVNDKRSAKVLYAIKLDDGRRIVKVYDSQLVRILDETVELEKRSRKTVRVTQANREAWTDEVIAEEISKIVENVGKTVTLTGGTTGRIKTIVIVRRSQCLMYAIEIAAPTVDNPDATRTIHKVTTSADLQISDERDEAYEALNAAYKARREVVAERSATTPEDRVIACEEAVKRAEEKLQKAVAELEAKKAKLEEARKALGDKAIDPEATSDAPAEATSDEPEATNDDAEESLA